MNAPLFFLILAGCAGYVALMSALGRRLGQRAEASSTAVLHSSDDYSAIGPAAGQLPGVFAKISETSERRP